MHEEKPRAHETLADSGNARFIKGLSWNLQAHGHQQRLTSSTHPVMLQHISTGENFSRPFFTSMQVSSDGIIF